MSDTVGKINFRLNNMFKVPDYISNKVKKRAEKIIDNINRPAHYTQFANCECIDITEQFNFCKGNAIKYIWRAGHKEDEIQDLKKAIWYLEREIKRLEGK